MTAWPQYGAQLDSGKSKAVPVANLYLVTCRLFLYASLFVLPLCCVIYEHFAYRASNSVDGTVDIVVYFIFPGLVS